MDPCKLKRLKQMEISWKFSLENRIAIGTGEAIALCFAGVGAHIVIAELDVDRGKGVARKARDHGHKPHFLKVAIQLSAAT